MSSAGYVWHLTTQSGNMATLCIGNPALIIGHLPIITIPCEAPRGSVRGQNGELSRHNTAPASMTQLRDSGVFELRPSVCILALRLSSCIQSCKQASNPSQRRPTYLLAYFAGDGLLACELTTLRLPPAKEPE